MGKSKVMEENSCVRDSEKKSGKAEKKKEKKESTEIAKLDRGCLTE